MLVPIVLFGWIGVALAFFATLSSRRAVLLSYFGAWMFLPNAHYSFPGIPDFDKSLSASIGALLGILIFDGGRLKNFKPNLFDWSILAVCLGPFATSISNGLGPYDGLSSAFGATAVWFPPYLCGRIYLRSVEDFNEFARIMIWGGIIYMPLCWIEIRFSPQLHRWVYGFMQHSFAQHIRYGGFRPIVFMQHGLMVSFWMATSAIVVFWLWQTKWLYKVAMFDVRVLFGLLLSTTILCKSMNAIILLSLGVAFYYVARTRLAKTAILLLLCAPAIWIGVRATGVWSGDSVKAVISAIDEERAGSLAARMKQEDLFSIKARERIIFGWGGWMRMFPRDAEGNLLTRGVDGFWVVMFGKSGLVGLCGFLGVLLQGPLSACLAVPMQNRIPVVAIPVVVFCVIGGLYAEDCLFNAMLNPIFTMSAAGLQNAKRTWFGVAKLETD